MSDSNDKKKEANDFLEKKKQEAKDKMSQAKEETSKKKDIDGSKGLNRDKPYAKSGEYTDKQMAAREKFKEMIKRKKGN